MTPEDRREIAEDMTRILLITMLVLLALVAFGGFVQGQPLPNRCVDAIWFQKPCDGQPVPLGTHGSPADCSAHTKTAGAEVTEDGKVYVISNQCPTDLDLPCRGFGRPADEAGPVALGMWDRCYVPPVGCGPNERTIRGIDGQDYQTSGKPPTAAGGDAIALWERCYLPRFRVSRSCPGRPAPGGRQTIRLWTLAAVPFPPPLAGAQRAAKALAYGCDLGLPTSTPAPIVGTQTQVPTSAATRTRIPTRRPSGPVPCDTILGGPICTPTSSSSRTRTAGPPTAAPTSIPATHTHVPGPVATWTMIPNAGGSPTPISTKIPSPPPSGTPSGGTTRPTPSTPSPGPTGSESGKACGGVLGVTIGTAFAAAVVGRKRWTSRKG